MEILLFERWQQLKEIDERLEQMCRDLVRLGVMPLPLQQLRFDLGIWIERAEKEYHDF